MIKYNEFNKFFKYNFIILENDIKLILILNKKYNVEELVDLEIFKDIILLKINKDLSYIVTNEEFYNNLVKHKEVLIFSEIDFININDELQKVDETINEQSIIDILNKNINDRDEKIKYLTYKL